jgi:Patatin-like phospholipase
MPSDYLTELAVQVYAWITADESKKTANEKEQIKDLLHELGLAQPTSVDDIKARLEGYPALQAHSAWKTGYTPSKWLLENELVEVSARREKHGIAPVDSNDDAYARAAKSGLMGICFSGGGIRSATFNLGILQGLAQLKLLHCFDYLSSVSGGGYIHQWLAAWGKRDGFANVAEKLIPLPEEDSPHSHPEPIRWLRRFSNYLTPERGLFTADTWVAIATWLRNTILNEIILISGLLFLVLLPHILTFPSNISSAGPATAIAIGAVFLFLMATFFLGTNLFFFRRHAPTGDEAFGQTGVQLGLVIPLLASSLLFAMLFRVTSSTGFGMDFWSSFVPNMLLLLALALTIVFWGKAPLAYLHSHHRTSGYQSVSEFWGKKSESAHWRMVFVIVALFAAAALAAACGAAWIGLTDCWIARLLSHPGSDSWRWRLTLVIEPPLILMGPLLTVLLLLGLLGRTFDDARREWLARLGAWVGLYALAWIGAVGVSLFGCAAVGWFIGHKPGSVPHIKTMAGALLTWAGTSLGGLLAAKSPKTAGAKDDKAPSKVNLLEILAVVAPYVFIAGLLLLLSALAEVMLDRVLGHGWVGILITFLAPLAICVLFAWRVDINEFSMHAFYRNRLARCYLGASTKGRDPNPFSGFDEEDTEIAVSDLLPENGYHGPFPIFCTALNLTFGEDLAWQERKAASYAFTPLFSGYDVGWTAAKGAKSGLRFNGFARTSTYAYPEPGIHVSTAVAISGAALSPNWGYHSNPATAFLLTVFNVRLGWWLRNPRSLDENGKQLDPGYFSRLIGGPYPSPSPHLSLLYLTHELLGQTNDTSHFVYLSDGGHFDNMGLYELVRRRCRYIVICDAEDDGQLKFEGIGMSIRKCRIDFGAEVAFDLCPLQHVSNSDYSSAHCVVGTIRYPEDKPGDKPGIVVYIKSSLTGDEPADILNYKKEHSAFPHDTTLNQWFTESQFESYRRLGHHVALATFDPARPEIKDCSELAQRREYFDNLGTIWFAPTPEMDRYSAEHSNRYDALLRRIREDALLPGFFDRLFYPLDVPWEKEAGRTAAQIEHARGVSFELIEFMFVVYLELNLVLPEKRDHPFSKGWYLIFNNWSQIDAVQHGWETYRDGYSTSFRLFAQLKMGLQAFRPATESGPG